MQPESMVHALEQIHSLLEPGGKLIDIHPNGELAEIIYPLEGQAHLIGYVQETDDYIEYRQADEAIETVVSKGLFQVEKMGQFEFLTHADSFDELKAFLDENWGDAVILDEVVTDAKKLEAKYGEYKTILRQQARIGLLKPIH